MASRAQLPTITGFRPSISLRGPKVVEASAISSTTIETERPAMAGETPNSWERIGRIGWVTYISEKTITAAR
jgi:hypothetical protein